MSQSALTTLREQVKTAFHEELEEQRELLRNMSEADASTKIADTITSTIDSFLDEKSETYTQMLLLCCLEDQDLFTKEPISSSCISSNGSPGQVNGQHCVYHNLYDSLRTLLEHEFEAW